MWPAFIAAYENCLNDAANRTIHAKVQGQLKNFLSYKMLCLVCTYLDVLEKITPASKVFEGEGLLAYEVMPSVDYTLMELEECKESAGEADEFLDSNLARFKLREDTEGGFSLSAEYLKDGEASKKAADKRAFMTYNFEGMRHLSNKSRVKASRSKAKVIENLSSLLSDRFNDFRVGIYDQMAIFDPKNWSNEKDYGNEGLAHFASHFQETLSMTSFDLTRATNEWRMLRNYARVWLPNVEAGDLWKKILAFKRQEFPNICALTEILISLSGSNSTVERGFSVLTNILSDRRLSMKHRRMESVLMISVNDKNWSQRERDDILERAVDIYLEKRRKTKMSEPPSKRPHLDGTVQEKGDVSLVDDVSDCEFWNNSEFSDSESE